MAESDSTYRISGLYVTPNWNGNSDRVAMSCGIGATIKVLRKVDVVIAADPGATLPKTWNMTARNTILRTTNKVYLYARVERNGVNGMYIWSANFYDVTGVAGDKVAVNNEQYYYIRVGELGALSNNIRPDFKLDYGQYGVTDNGTETESPKYNWDDLMYFDAVNKVIVFLYNLATIAFNSIVLAGKELGRVLTGSDVEYDHDSGKYTLAEGAESDGAVVTGGFLKEWVNIITGKFIRKDKDDETAHQLTMQKAVVRSSVETQGYNGKDSIDGTGAAMWEVDERGEKIGHIVTDYITVRRAATFRNLSIIEVNHMGGEVIISAADCDIAYVDPLDADGNLCSPADAVRFRCYFEKEANGRVVYNEWKRNDQAYCRRFNVAEKSEVDGSFYWRMVLDVHNATENETFHWIDLSNILDDEVPQVALDSNTPKADDKIVVFGHQCHRDNPDESNYDRTCAQMYSTVGINAPSRDYYYGIGTLTDKYGNITPFALPSSSMEGVGRNNEDGVYWHVGDGNHYMKYSTEKGLDIRTSSMTVIADGGDKEIDVAEVLGDSLSFFTTENEARKEGEGYVEWMAAAELVPNEADKWDSSVWKNYLNYQIITPHGITYKLDMNGDEVMWHLNTDRYLLHAQETADAAVKNLDDMASDNVITLQEKPRLNDIYTQINEEGTNVFNDATQVGMRDTDTRVYRVWRSALMAMINYIVSREGDVELVKENGEQLVVTMQRYDSIPSVSYDVPDVVVSPMTPDPTSHKVTYKDCYKWYYYRLSQVRQAITVAMRRSIDNIVVNGSDVNEYVRGEISNLRDGLQETNGIVSKLDGDIGALATIVHYPDESVEFSGFVTKSNFASVFSSETSKDGNEVSAIITAYVDKGVSGISLSADKIDFAAADITMFSQNFRIDADNFKVNDDGVYVRGEIHATSGTFDGTVKASQGFQLGYKSVRYVEENRDEDEATVLDKGDSVVFVEYRVQGPGVILPQQPLDGQVVKIISTGSFPVRVYSNNSYIEKLGSQSRSVTVPAHSVGEFIYGQNKWYYTGNYNCS